MNKCKLFRSFSTLIFGLLLFHPTFTEAQEQLPVETVESISKEAEDSRRADPSSGYTSRLDEINRDTREEPLSEKEQTFFRGLLWYLPNRVIDFFDIFRVDVGIGGAAGGVLRATRYGQVGGRYISPLSARVGIRGRTVPFFLEKHSEAGFGSNFQQTPNRHVTPYEVGVGVDAIVGGYVGISFDELLDFFAGFALFDLKQDDLVS